MFLRLLPTRGMPTRGSIQDRILCEMLARDRQATIAQSTYLGRLLSVGLQLPEPVFQLWTSLLAIEVRQESYNPSTIEAKKYALETMEDNVKDQKQGRMRMFKKLAKLTMGEDDLRPVSPAELEAFKRKLRRRHLNRTAKL